LKNNKIQLELSHNLTKKSVKTRNDQQKINGKSAMSFTLCHCCNEAAISLSSTERLDFLNELLVFIGENQIFIKENAFLFGV
jgi:hypothetical protein